MKSNENHQREKRPAYNSTQALESELLRKMQNKQSADSIKLSAGCELRIAKKYFDRKLYMQTTGQPFNLSCNLSSIWHHADIIKRYGGYKKYADKIDMALEYYIDRVIEKPDVALMFLETDSPFAERIDNEIFQEKRYLVKNIRRLAKRTLDTEIARLEKQEGKLTKE